MVSGAVNAKQIELEFMNLIGAASWKWIAKLVGEGKFTMRFPTEKMVQEWSFLHNLHMRNGAHITIEAWSPIVGAKGVLQSAWFRVSKIPYDQRSIRTLAKVGGLVGKVLEIDESTCFRYDYVRLKIACHDITKVPKMAEGTLGMYIIDFEFKREVSDNNGERMLKSGIKVGEEQPPPKRSKPDQAPENQKMASKQSDKSASDKQDQGKSSGKQTQEVYWSAPPKIDFNRRSQSKVMSDAQKAHIAPNDREDNDKVHIPETFEDSDTDSDSFCQRIKDLTGAGDKGQSSHTTMFVQTKIFSKPAPDSALKSMETDVSKDTLPDNKHVSEKGCGSKAGQSPEVFISEDNIINTQESVEDDDQADQAIWVETQAEAQETSNPEAVVEDL